VGTTFQAGRIAATQSMRESNLWLARAAGLRPNTRVLDAGCGVCGPSIDIVREIAGIHVVGITIATRQASTANTLVHQAGVSDRIHVVSGDYHALPFVERTFDSAVFLESMCYADSLTTLLTGVYRVLRPGGSLYIKDVFRRERLWADQEVDELIEFNEVYAVRTPTLTECIDAAADSGFTRILTRDLSELVSTTWARQAMFDARDNATLTSFGRLHHRRYSCLPVYFVELTALRAPE
jgi:cyclopropane fatty-acyl-phospholipid synthase-like methyltransferase